MTQAMAGHHQRSIKHRAARLNGQHRLAHDLGGRGVQRQLGQRHPAEHIVAREDAAQRPLLVGQEHRANFMRVHQAQHLAQGGCGWTADRLALGQLGNGAFEVTLLLHLGLKFLAPAPAGILQKSEHALVQEIGPRRACAHHGTGSRPRDEQTKAVIQGAIGAADPPPRQQGGHGEEAADIQLKNIVRLHRTGAPTQRTALAQKNQVLNRRCRRDDDRLGRKVALVCSKRQLLHVGALHAGKRQMSEQGRHPVLEQLMRRLSAHGTTITRPDPPGNCPPVRMRPSPKETWPGTQPRVSQ